MKKGTKLLNRQFARKSQGVEVVEHLEIDGRKVRLTIYTDSHKQQGHCHLDVLNTAEMKWNQVVSRSPEAMETAESLCYLPDIKTRNLEADFAKDRAYLLGTYALLTRV